MSSSSNTNNKNFNNTNDNKDNNNYGEIPITFVNPNFIDNETDPNFKPIKDENSIHNVYLSMEIHRNSTSFDMNLVSNVREDDENRSVSHNTNENNNDRESWTDKMDFVFNAIGYVMGVGNIWKFPFYVVKYGGGFCIVYALLFFLFGIPTVLLEIYIGQFTNRGTVQCWGHSAILRGIGLGMVVKTFIELQTYTMITVRIFKYIGLSFNPHYYFINSSLETKGVSSLKFYFDNDGFGTGQITKNFENFGLPKYELVIAGFITWTGLFFCLWMGLKYSGKLIYATVIIPAVFLIILLFYGLAHKGSAAGINKYFNQLNFSKPEMWLDAAIQMMFSMGIASGGLTTLASYRKFKAELIGNAIFISCIDFLASIIGSLFLLSFLGNIENYSNRTIDENSLSEYYLIFSVIPQAIMDNDSSLAVLWLLLLFLTMLTLAFDSTLTMYRVVICGFFEVFGYPAKEKEKYFYLGFSFLGFIFCIPMCCPGGMYWEAQIGNGIIWGYIITELLLFIFMICFYGSKNISYDIECMTKNPKAKKIWSVIKWYFIMCWYFWIPAIFISLFFTKVATYRFYSIPGKILPTWMHFFEVFITLCVFLSILLYIGFYFISSNGSTVRDKFKSLIVTDVNKPLWYPSTNEKQNEVENFKTGKSKGCIIDIKTWTINTTE